MNLANHKKHKITTTQITVKYESTYFRKHIKWN